MSIKSLARPLRLSITTLAVQNLEPEPCVELSAELSRGMAGAEIRSAEPSAPFHLRIRLRAAEVSSADFSFNIKYGEWEGKPLARLPWLEPLLKLSQALSQQARLILDVIECGERQTLMSVEVEPRQTARGGAIVGALRFVSHISGICRKLGIAATYRHSDMMKITDAQRNNLALAHRLVQGQCVSIENISYVVTPNDVGRDVLRAGERGLLTSRVPLLLEMGTAKLGELPVVMFFNKYDVKENQNGSFTIEATAPADVPPEAAKR